MTLVINYVSDTIVSGYDIQDGLRRNVNGVLQQSGNALRFVMSEPGNNRFDGIFDVALDTATWSITGRWLPQDSARIHGGSLDLKRWEKDTGVNVEEVEWHGKRGTLYFGKDGTCQISSSGPHRTIWGIYEQKGNTIFIDWEPNNDFPGRKMKLTRMGYTSDNPDEGPPILEGDGLKFEENIAG